MNLNRVNALEITPLELHIIRVATAEFLQRGIDRVDMREIAQKAEISRTTLYRHFSCKEILASYVTMYTLQFCQKIELDFSPYSNGLEKLRAAVNELARIYAENPNMTKYIAQYDLIFTDDADMDSGLHIFFSENAYSEDTTLSSRDSVDAGSDYFSMIGDASANPIAIFERLIQEGQRDGSIRNDRSARFIGFTLINSLKSTAASVLLRKEHLKREQGFGSEMMDYFIDLLLRGLRT